MHKIYVIEDDPFLQKLILGKLKSVNFDVMGVKSWNDAENNISDFHPDLLILDLMLPEGIDGFEVLENIRKNPKLNGLKIIVFSNVASLEAEKRSIKLGANAFMIKSNFTLDELVDKINELVK